MYYLDHTDYDGGERARVFVQHPSKTSRNSLTIFCVLKCTDGLCRLHKSLKFQMNKELPRLEKIEDLVNNHQREIINFHFRFTGNRFDAEDLAQETFIKAYKKLDTLKDPEKARSWLYSIARNTAIDFFRRNKNKDIVLDNALLENMAGAATTDYQNLAIRKEVSRELDCCIDKLVKEDRAIIRLLYYEGFSYKEITELLHINENTLKSRLHRARSVLLEMIRTSKFSECAALQYEK